MATSKKSEKPDGQQFMEASKFPSFLLQLETSSISNGSFYIISSSGKLLVTDDKLKTDLHLVHDHCTTASDRERVDLTTDAEATTAVGLKEYDCQKARWRLWKTDDKWEK